LKQGLIPPEPDARLLLDVSGHFQKGCLFEIHGEQAVFDAHRLSTPNMLLEKEDKKRRCDQANTQKRFCGFQNHFSFPEQRESYPAFQAALPPQQRHDFLEIISHLRNVIITILSVF
jgi:hypothetical protein